MNNIKIVKLYADWCAPCKVLHKMMSDNNIEFENIDVATEKGIKLSSRHNIKNIPAILIFDDNGKFLRKKIGFPKDIKELNNFLYEINYCI